LFQEVQAVRGLGGLPGGLPSVQLQAAPMGRPTGLEVGRVADGPGHTPGVGAAGPDHGTDHPRGIAGHRHSLDRKEEALLRQEAELEKKNKKLASKPNKKLD